MAVSPFRFSRCGITTFLPRLLVLVDIFLGAFSLATFREVFSHSEVTNLSTSQQVNDIPLLVNGDRSSLLCRQLGIFQIDDLRRSRNDLN